ncbi:endonuclease domain-containing protein [Microbacterium sp. 179-I 3D2 NHS]|uniref:endonuclease domain-containing protein n=1 Tax=Microbacterium sp. 179-I 3D2 NHS TaxID=3235178 RepID=UPI0039A01166
MRSVEELVAELGRKGGVARTAWVTEQGFSRRRVDDAVRRGAVIRPRRGWLADPHAERTLLAAARFGVVLTCRTQAALLGLWVHDPSGPPHFAVPPHSRGRLPIAARLHWGSAVVPRHPDALVDPIENVLAHIAECEPFERALATWESALNRALVTVEALRNHDWRPAARRVLDHALPFADAGLETYLRVRLRWLREPIRVQIWIAGHRVDTLIGERLVVQIDGAHHVGAQRSEDIRHDAELRLQGFHVIRVSYPQVMFEWPSVQDLIMRAVAHGLHRSR